MRVRGGSLSCQHKDKGSPFNRIECQLRCKKGWENVNDIDATICTKSQAEALAKIKNLTSHTRQKHRASIQKMTNFTTDYLECRRSIPSTSTSYPETTNSPQQNNFETTSTTITIEILSTSLQDESNSVDPIKAGLKE